MTSGPTRQMFVKAVDAGCTYDATLNSIDEVYGTYIGESIRLLYSSKNNPLKTNTSAFSNYHCKHKEKSTDEQGPKGTSRALEQSGSKNCQVFRYRSKVA